MRIEVHVDLHRKTKKPPEPATVNGRPDKTPSREKRLRWIALALVINEMVLTGEWENYAEASRACRVSRARITKLMALLCPIDARA